MTETHFESLEIETMREKETSRIAVVPAFIGMIALALCAYFLLTKLAVISEGNDYIYDFVTLMQGAAEGSILWKIGWFMADVTEGTFIASLPATILLMVGSYIGASLERKRRSGAGTGVDGNGDIFTVMTLSGFAAILIGTFAFQSLFDDGYFVPTFAAFLSVQAMIIYFRATTFIKAATVTILGTLTEVPACFWFVKHFTTPNDIPLFLAVGVSIIITVPICSEIMRMLPWMKMEELQEAAADEEVAPAPLRNENLFFVNRIFGDVCEQILWGSSIGAVLMYIGAILGVILNPLHAGFTIANVISVQLATGALAVFIWYPRWKNDGWAFTFAPLLFVSAITVTFTFSLKVIIPSIIISAVCIPPLIPWVMGKIKISGRYAPIVCILISVCSICIPWSFFVANVLN